MRTINASFSAMQPASEQDDIVNSPNYEDIAGDAANLLI